MYGVGAGVLVVEELTCSGALVVVVTPVVDVGSCVVPFAIGELVVVVELLCGTVSSSTCEPPLPLEPLLP